MLVALLVWGAQLAGAVQLDQPWLGFPVYADARQLCAQHRTGETDALARIAWSVHATTDRPEAVVSFYAEELDVGTANEGARTLTVERSMRRLSIRSSSFPYPSCGESPTPQEQTLIIVSESSPQRVGAVAGQAESIPAHDNGRSITSSGWGPVQIGMTPSEASSAMGGWLSTSPGYSGTESCHYMDSPTAPGLLFMVTKGIVSRVDTKDRRYATESGVRVGETEAEARREHAGQMVEHPHRYVDDGYYFYIYDPDRKHAVVIEIADGRVVEIRGGRVPEVLWVEHCL
jgi:hypothetical protein